MDYLKQIVRINETGLVADAVNFGMMDDDAKNLSLCKGFVFNYSAEDAKSSTVGVLERVRRSFHSPAEPNVHLVVQDYGKGKSHFALVIANYFRKRFDSPEVEGLLEQVRLAAGPQHAIVDELVAHKKRTRPYFVLTMSGDRQVDLKQMLIREIRLRLSEDGVTGSIAQTLCLRPLEYLRTLKSEEIARADQYLETQHLDVAALIKVLEQDGYQQITIVREISKQLTGYPIDFDADIGTEQILQDLITKLCNPGSGPYQGVLILFDELNAYLQSWAVNPVAAGGMALQNITNICENNKSRIAFVCFTQIKPGHASALPANSPYVKDYKKLTSRIELGPSTYEPMSSLELVLDNLINPQHQARWQEFIKAWRNTLQAESEKAYARCLLYTQRRWPQSDFFQHLVQGCFPLHPLTAYLLCNLDFMQGRTAIQFVKENVKQYIEFEPADKNGFLNFMRPIHLVNAFRTNLTNHPAHPDYEKAVSKIRASATEQDLQVLDALFLFYVCGGKLKKPDNEPHEHLIALLTGLSVDQAREGLHRLSEQLGVIYLFAATSTYRFYTGAGLDELRRFIEETVQDTRRDVQDVAEYLQERIVAYFHSDFVEPSQFVAEQRLVAEDWRFAKRVMTAAKAKELLDRGVIETARGVVAIVLFPTSAEAQLKVVEFEEELARSSVADKLVIAIIKDGLAEVAEMIVKLRALRQMGSQEKERYGEAYGQLVRQYEAAIDKRLEAASQDYSICATISESLPKAERNNLEAICSRLLLNRYGYAPPVEGVDKLRAGHRVGQKIVTYMVKELLTKTLTQNFPDSSYKTVIESVFVRSWHVLQLSGTKYSAQAPTNSRLRTAWNVIDNALPLVESEDSRVALAELWRQLSAEPFGYNDLTYAALLGAWIAVHRTELRVIVKKKIGAQAPQEITIAQFCSDPEFDGNKFINTLQRDGVFLGRRAAISDVHVPPKMPADEALKVAEKIRECLAGGAVAPDRGTQLGNILRALQLLTSVCNSWEQKGNDYLRRLSSAPVSEVVDAYRHFQEIPETCATKLGLEVTLSGAQRALRISGMEQAKAVLQARIASLKKEATKVESEDQLRSISAHIERDREALSRNDELSAALSSELTAARNAVETQLSIIQMKALFDQTVKAVKELMSAVGPASSQTQLESVQRALGERAKHCDQFKCSREYRDAKQRLDKLSGDLSQWVSECKTRAENVKSSIAAQALISEITARSEKIDSPEDAQRLRLLLAQLRSRVEELKTSEQIETIVGDYLKTIREDSARVLRQSDIKAALSAYGELVLLHLPEGLSQEREQQIRVEAAQHCGRAREHLRELITSVCREQPVDGTICEQLEKTITSVEQDVAALTETSDMVPMLAAAKQQLHHQKDFLEQEAREQLVLQEIRNMANASMPSIVACDAAISAIEDRITRLNDPARHIEECSKLLEVVRRRRQSIIEQLTKLYARLDAVTTTAQIIAVQRAYDQLRTLFAGAQEEDLYSEFERGLDSRRGALEKLDAFRSDARNARTASQMQAILAKLDEAVAAAPQWTTSELISVKVRVEESLTQLTTQLKSWLAAVAAAATRKEATRLINEIASHRAEYDSPRVQSLYEELALCADAIGTCEDLKQLITSASTEEALEELQHRISELEHEVGGQVPFVKSRCEGLLTEIRNSIEKLRERETSALKSQLLSIQRAIVEIPKGAALAERLACINSILHRVHQLRQLAPGKLPEAETIQLASMDVQLSELVNKDTVSEIISLFLQLPADQRSFVLRQLSDHVFDGLGMATAASEERI